MEVKFKSRLQRRRPGAVNILNRIVAVASGGLEYEADQRQEDILMKDMGIDEESQGVITPRSSGERGTGARAVSGQLLREESVWVQMGWTCSMRPRRSRGSCRIRRSKTGGQQSD